MKKILFMLMLLVSPLMVFAENDYKVISHYIDSEIEISGNLRVKELIIVDGNLDYFTRVINYKTFDGVWDKKNTSLVDNPIYNGSGIYNFAVSAYKYNDEKVNFNDLSANVKSYFKELDPKKVSDSTYKVDKKSGENSYNIYFKNSGRTAIYLEYVVGDVIVTHNDVRELNYSFKNLSYEAIDTYLRVIIPYPTDEESYQVYLHGNGNGEFEDIEKDGVKYGVFAHYSNVKKEINVRLTLPLDQIAIDNGSNHTDIEALDKIISIEKERMDGSKKGANINNYAKYVLCGLSIVYVLISIIVYKQKNSILNIVYFVLGVLISLFNYLFKTGIWYIYLIMLVPVIVIILSKRK